MTTVSERPRRAWGVVLVLGVVALLGAAILAFSPGFRVAPPVPFGETLTVELTAGDHAVYVTPSNQWASIECTGTVADGQLFLLPDMTQQGLLVPAAWDAQGRFATDSAGTATISCDGPVAGGRFTVGPHVSFLALVGAAGLGLLGVILVIVGVILRAVRPRHP